MKKTRKLTTRIAMLPISIPIVIVGILVSPMAIAVDWGTSPDERYTLEAAAAAYFGKLFSAI